MASANISFLTEINNEGENDNSNPIYHAVCFLQSVYLKSIQGPLPLIFFSLRKIITTHCAIMLVATFCSVWNYLKPNKKQLFCLFIQVFIPFLYKIE